MDFNGSLCKRVGRGRKFGTLTHREYHRCDDLLARHKCEWARRFPPNRIHAKLHIGKGNIARGKHALMLRACRIERRTA